MDMRKQTWPMIVIVCVVLLGHEPSAAIAAEEIDQDEQTVRPLEPMRVMADFRGAFQDSLPVSVTVLDRQLIQDAGYQHLESLVHMIPNLNWAGGSSRPRYYQIRGIGEREQYEGAPNPSIGFLIDDIDFSAMGGIATLFDVEQVEVLRGPQGTRLGANALAGLINIKTRDPTPFLTLDAEGMVGQDNARAAGVAVSGPAGEQLAYRISAHKYQSDGFRRNDFVRRDDTNGRDELSTRGKLRWTPGDRVEVDFTGMYVDIDNGYDAWALDNGLTTLSDNPGRDTQRTGAGAARVTWEAAPSFDVVSITTAASNDVVFSFDGDWVYNGFWGALGPNDFSSATFRDRRMVSQEFRLFSTPGTEILGGTTSWLAGVYFMNLNETNDILDLYNGEIFRDLESDYEATNAAAFGQFDIVAGERTTVSLGLRLEQRHADYRDSNGVSFTPVDTMPGGHVSVSFDAHPQLMLYGKVARGYKAGGFNIGPSIPVERREFEPEFLWDFEVGVKGHLPNWRLSGGLSLFYMLRDKAQVSTSFQIDPTDPLSFVFFTDNAANGVNYGAEIEALWAFRPYWTLQGSVGLLRTRFDDYVTPTRVLDGRAQAHAPSYMFDVALTYRGPRGLFALVDIAAKDEFFYDTSHDQKSEPYELVNLKLGYEARHWGAYVWGRNVLGERYTVRGFFFANEPPDWIDKLYTRQGDPRQYGVTFTYRY